jgi:uncharacterized protein
VGGRVSGSGHDGPVVTAERLSLSQARRVVLRAHGLDRPRPVVPGGPGMRQLQQVVDRLGVIQIDSVNVFARAHLMPAFSRLGPYDTGLLDRATSRAPRRLVESWAHMASYVAPATYPLLEWRRHRYEKEAWGVIRSVPLQSAGVVEEILGLVAERGPLTASQVQLEYEAEHPTRREDWGWNWSLAKRVLEFLFFTGRLVPAGRNPAFERRYDLTSRVLPPDVLAQPAPDEPDAVRALVEIAARAHGLGSVRCLADHFRIGIKPATSAVADLVDAGVLAPVEVDGWGRAYRHRDAVLPRAATGSALLSPFDPLLFERKRVEALFGLRYRIEIYVPEPQRVWGYYVLPFLLGEHLVALVDLKADRAAGVLRVVAAHTAPGGEGRSDVADALAAELALAAHWQGLDAVVVGDAAGRAAGDLVGALRGALELAA